jgi:hypothetical protein
MGDIQKRDSFSFAYDGESSFGVKPGAPSWNVLECEYPDITFSRTIEEFALSKSKDFEESKRAIGSSDGGTFTVRAPLTSQLSTYDPTSGAPIANPLVALIEDVFGSVVTGSTGLAIAASGSDGNTWELASGTLLAGSAYAAGTGSGFAVSAMGFTQDVSGGTTIEFREDNRATPAAADDVYPMRTLTPPAC